MGRRQHEGASVVTEGVGIRRTIGRVDELTLVHQIAEALQRRRHVGTHGLDEILDTSRWHALRDDHFHRSAATLHLLDMARGRIRTVRRREERRDVLTGRCARDLDVAEVSAVG